MNRDFLNVIECVYRPDLADEEAWMGALLEALLPVIGEGFGVLGMFVDASDPTALHFGDVIGRGASEDFRANVRPNMAEFSPDVFSRALVGQPEIVSTMATVFGAEALGASPTFEKHYEAAGMRDSLLLLATDASGRGCAIAAGRAAIGSVPPDLREPLERVVIHATTALRLRRALAKEASGDGEAVLLPSGKIEHATGEATHATAAQALRDAAIAIDRARSLRKKDPITATELWKGLANGTWSLVDRFDSDGKRYLIAMRNEPAGARVATLRPREAQIVALVALGRSSKLIAYELGMNEATVSRYMASAMGKLGITSRAALAKYLATAVGSGDGDIHS
jgi:DNA-binding CsgD family transcriptional regulator